MPLPEYSKTVLYAHSSGLLLTIRFCAGYRHGVTFSVAVFEVVDTPFPSVTAHMCWYPFRFDLPINFSVAVLQPVVALVLFVHVIPDADFHCHWIV